MRKKHYYDLDEVERGTRAMFAEIRKIPLQDGAQGVMQSWQNRSEDLLVAFMRFSLSMEMEGIQDQMAARIVGVVLAEQAQNFWNSFQGGYQIEALMEILRAFQDHSNQCMAVSMSGGAADGEFPINPVQAEHA